MTSKHWSELRQYLALDIPKVVCEPKSSSQGDALYCDIDLVSITDFVSISITAYGNRNHSVVIHGELRTGPTDRQYRHGPPVSIRAGVLETNYCSLPSGVVRTGPRPSWQDANFNL